MEQLEICWSSGRRLALWNDVDSFHVPILKYLSFCIFDIHLAILIQQALVQKGTIDAVDRHRICRTANHTEKMR